MSLRGRPEAGPAPSGPRQFLVVACGRSRFAVPAEAVRGLRLPEAAALGPPDHGLVADLGTRLGLHRDVPARSGGVILVGTDTHAEQFDVDEVLGLTDVEPQAIRPLPAHFSGSERERFAGLFLFGDGLAFVINPWGLEKHEGGVARSGTWIEAEPVGEGQGQPVEADAARPVLELAATVASEPAAGVEAVDGIVIEEVTDGKDAPWADI